MAKDGRCGFGLIGLLVALVIIGIGLYLMKDAYLKKGPGAERSSYVAAMDAAKQGLGKVKAQRAEID